MRQLLWVAWYRFSASFARTWGGLVAVVLLIGLTGGIALGSIAGARRTQSSYPKFLASTDPSDLTVSSFGPGGATVASLKSVIARVPDVKRVTSVDVAPFTVVTAAGAPIPSATASVFMVASSDGELFGEDRATVVHGRMADAARANEVVLTPSAARGMELILRALRDHPDELTLDFGDVARPVVETEPVQRRRNRGWRHRDRLA